MEGMKSSLIYGLAEWHENRFSPHCAAQNAPQWRLVMIASFVRRVKRLKDAGRRALGGECRAELANLLSEVFSRGAFTSAFDPDQDHDGPSVAFVARIDTQMSTGEKPLPVRARLNLFTRRRPRNYLCRDILASLSRPTHTGDA